MPRLFKILAVLAFTALLAGGGFLLWQYTASPDLVASTALRWPQTYEQVRYLEDAVDRGSHSANTYVQLGYAYVQSARETGDGVATDRGEEAFRKALSLEQGNAEALAGLGTIYLSRHQFQTALDWGHQALAANPHRPRTYGILVDGYLELGQYDEAVAAAQKMVDMRPDLASYSRAAYLRELYGDVDGAIDAMQRAISAGSGSLENTNWSRVQLGNLYFHRGDLDRAEQTYRIALNQLPHYGHALAALARVELARGRAEEAVALYRDAALNMPIPEHDIGLAEAYEAAGQAEAEAAAFDAVIAVLEEERQQGMDVDDELAALLLDRDRNLPYALTLAQGVYQRRPTVSNADILAWAYFKNRQYEGAYRMAEKALQLGTRHAVYEYHAGRIAAALGDTAGAVQHFQEALAMNPYFSTEDAEAAQQLLAQWGPEVP